MIDMTGKFRLDVRSQRKRKLVEELFGSLDGTAITWVETSVPDQNGRFHSGVGHCALHVVNTGKAERELLDGINKLFEVYRERKAAE